MRLDREDGFVLKGLMEPLAPSPSPGMWVLSPWVAFWLGLAWAGVWDESVRNSGSW